MIATAIMAARGHASSSKRGSQRARVPRNPSTVTRPADRMIALRLAFWPSTVTRSPPVQTSCVVAAMPNHWPW